MDLKFETFPFTPVLGWSISRYELFEKCKRQYYYTYYAKYAQQPPHTIEFLKKLTSVPLEIGYVIHEVLEAFLRRLQKSDSAIDEKRFFTFAKSRAQECFDGKTFLEVYYHYTDTLDKEISFKKIELCLSNFIGSPVYTWLFMKALRNKTNWLIEPQGYGETRLRNLKAYCKMDFLFPVDDCVTILDWKTGKKDVEKHTNQLIGYAAAASFNFNLPWNTIFPKIVYLNPQFEEFEVKLTNTILDEFYEKVETQTEAMKQFCANKEKNVPLPIDSFPLQPSQQVCRFCNFQELCFPDIHSRPAPQSGTAASHQDF